MLFLLCSSYLLFLLNILTHATSALFAVWLLFYASLRYTNILTRTDRISRCDCLLLSASPLLTISSFFLFFLFFTSTHTHTTCDRFFHLSSSSSSSSFSSSSSEARLTKPSRPVIPLFSSLSISIAFPSISLLSVVVSVDRVTCLYLFPPALETWFPVRGSSSILEGCGWSHFQEPLGVYQLKKPISVSSSLLAFIRSIWSSSLSSRDWFQQVHVFIIEPVSISVLSYLCYSSYLSLWFLTALPPLFLIF
ncbi:hypothetical protein B0I72DRAFT_47108 [Yarrowia lipolytica]|nr:hypothetical protein B0I72DRAFT_47108 [Yarrowia lipolytica]RDW40675.1 hypothetical protein B0I73DRAFT_21723 [Yarrowia lipolytica]RDW49026.1 hypothetical protein B0I74DRAFT_23835 [Yarrowia lipolytica]RDW56084.1 hypothetical protein B0I75DRAFT_16881 [Yarrowia lipolytica]